MRVTTLAGIPLALAAAAAALGYLGPARSAPDAGPTRLGGIPTTLVSDHVTARPDGALTAAVPDTVTAQPPGAWTLPPVAGRSSGRWCPLSTLSGQSAPAPMGTADRDARYERADPRRVPRQPTDPCRAGAA